jgi:hypothetical protein
MRLCWLVCISTHCRRRLLLLLPPQLLLLVIRKVLQSEDSRVGCPEQ